MLLSVITLAGCSNLPYRVASKANDYTYFEKKYEAACKTATPECVARQEKLKACKAALVDAAAAETRGGSAKYQEKDMKTACGGFK
jgi:hypothetical protein